MRSKLIAALLLGLSLGLAQAQESLSWEQLGEAEQQVLRPYAERWDSFTPQQQQRLQKGARRWQQMNSEERAAVRQRFEYWQQLSAEQKQRIRERFQEFQALPPTQQQRIREQMEAFRAMPEKQREALLDRWQSLSAEERAAIREQLDVQAGQQEPSDYPPTGETGAGEKETGESAAEVPEGATLPEQNGRLRDNHMERRAIETPTRRPR